MRVQEYEDEDEDDEPGLWTRVRSLLLSLSLQLYHRMTKVREQLEGAMKTLSDGADMVRRQEVRSSLTKNICLMSFLDKKITLPWQLNVVYPRCKCRDRFGKKRQWKSNTEGFFVILFVSTSSSRKKKQLTNCKDQTNKQSDEFDVMPSSSRSFQAADV